VSRDETRRPGRRRDQQAHQEILEATVHLLRDVGYQRLSIDAVAARAGVAKTTVYRWWANKAALVVEALETALNLPSPQPTGDSRTDIRAVVQRIADTFGAPPLGEVLPALAVDLSRDPDAQARLRTMLGPRRAANAAILLAAAGRRDLPPDVDVHLLLDMVAGAILYRSLLGRAPTTALVDQLTDFILGTNLPRT
jgi:AcrR family transcriptional regulator